MLFLIIVNFFELLSALVGTSFIRKNKTSNLTKYFVYFLWLTVFVEIIFGWLPRLVYYQESFSFLKGTFLAKNDWIYNTYFIISFLFYITYFKLNLISKKFRKILSVLSIIYLIACVIYLINEGIYFTSISSVTYITGSILIFLSVLLYFYEIIQSDTILSFHTNLTFYIAVGAMVFHLIATPLFIYSEYYVFDKNPDFVKVRRIILYSTNIFLYTCYIIGFIVCSTKNKSYS